MLGGVFAFVLGGEGQVVFGGLVGWFGGEVVVP